MEILKESLSIVIFVMQMMLLIEYITVQTEGKWNLRVQNSTWKQIVFSAFLGLIPGCVGGFFAVSLYTHRIINFASLVTVMIAATGDEAFVMFAMLPMKKFIILNLIVFAVAIIVGLIINLILKNRSLIRPTENHLKIHAHEVEHIYLNYSTILNQLKNISFHRALLIAGGVFFGIFLINEQHISQDFELDRFIYFAGTILGLVIVTVVPEHFLKEHLWGHVIKKHFIKMLLWTVATFILIHYIKGMIDIDEWIKSNRLLILVIAVLIGIIPQSGPNIVFINLFITGTIPFSVLVANSIVQDGHGSLPLLAESRKSFFVMKLVNVAVSILVGLAGMVFDW